MIAFLKCNKCGVTGHHTPMKKSKPDAEQLWRCGTCGDPPRSGNLNPKNIVWRTWDGRVMFGPRT